MTHWKLPGNFLIAVGMVLIAALSDAQAADNALKPDEELAAAITVGQAQWLEAGSERFLGIYTQATTGKPLGAAIILPGLGVHPNWPDVIAPLRQGLPAYRWSTLSIQLPTPTQSPDGQWLLEPYFTASRTRIQAAIGFLEKQGITNVALIGHGLGAAAAAVCLSGGDPLKVSAFAAVSLGIPFRSGPSSYRPGLVENIHVPMLDIFGSRDLDTVTSTAAARFAAAQRGGLVAAHNPQLEPLAHSTKARLPAAEQNDNIAYRQLEVMGADYRFRGAESILLNRIAGWLKNHAADVAMPAVKPAKS